MRHFLLGSAFLMFIASLPADATNDHTIPVEAPVKAVLSRGRWIHGRASALV